MTAPPPLSLSLQVLLLFIRTLEEQRGFSIRDKSMVGSLLMVALHNRLDYATECVSVVIIMPLCYAPPPLAGF